MLQFGDLICFCFLFETINKLFKVDKQRTFDSVTYIFSSHGTHTLTRVLRDKQKLGLKSLKSQNQSSTTINATTP